MREDAGERLPFWFWVEVIASTVWGLMLWVVLVAVMIWALWMAAAQVAHAVRASRPAAVAHDLVRHG